MTPTSLTQNVTCMKPMPRTGIIIVTLTFSIASKVGVSLQRSWKKNSLGMICTISRWTKSIRARSDQRCDV
jgi:hypothetical protein